MINRGFDAEMAGLNEHYGGLQEENRLRRERIGLNPNPGGNPAGGGGGGDGGDGDDPPPGPGANVYDEDL